MIETGKDTVQTEANTEATETPTESEQATVTGNQETQNETTEQVTKNETQEEKLLAGKYKTVEDLEKGYSELSKKVREKAPEAPEEYKYEFDSEDERLQIALKDWNPSEDPLVQALDPLFKKHNLSQEAVAEIAQAYLGMAVEGQVDPGEERKKLGADADKVISRVEQFVNNRFSAEEQQIAASVAETAEGLKFLNKLVDMTRERPVPAEAQQGPMKSPEELEQQAHALRKEPNFMSNPKMQKQYEELMDKAMMAKLKQ